MTMIRKFIIWYYRNISGNISVSLITFFFSATLSLYVMSNQYNYEAVQSLYDNRTKELDSILNKIEKNQYNLTKMVSYDNLFIKIDSINTKRLPYIIRGINQYVNNKIKEDSNKIYLDKYKNINSELPFNIGELEAYSNTNISERNSENIAALKYLRSEYEISKDLEKFFDKKLQQNDHTDKKIDEFYINIAAFAQHRKDSLSSESISSGKKDFLRGSNKFENKINRLKFNHNKYLIMAVLSLLIAVFLTYTAYRCGHLKR